MLRSVVAFALALAAASASTAPDAHEALLRAAYPANYDGSTMHMVFSVSCDQAHRLLLASVLQDSAIRVGQKGPITQIVAGCSEEEKAAIVQEPRFYYDFRVHFTPSYSPHPLPEINDPYTPYNKPFSLRHFLQSAEPPVQHEIIALVDGDFVFFKPLEVNTGRNMSKYYKGKRDPASVTDEVRDGVAIAQDWTLYMGSGWFGNETFKGLVCDGKPCMNVTADDAREFYAGTGPPYILTRTDALRFVDDYCAFVVRGRQLGSSDDWMTEMFAYAAAAANHGVKHTVLSNLGVTHPSIAGEGQEYWTFLDPATFHVNPCADPFEVALPEDPPVGVHFCQHYKFVDHGRYFYKYALPREIVHCDAALLVVPPATEYAQVATMEGDAAVRSKKRHEVWAECTLTKAVNQALLRIKAARCGAVGANTFHGLELVEKA